MRVFNLSDAQKRRTVDIHHDFEFVDEGPAGLHIISMGAVFEGYKRKKLLYAINRDFFSTPLFKRMCETNNEQNTWMFDNVFTHINVRVETRQGQVRLTAKGARKAVAAGKTVTVLAVDQKVQGRGNATVIVGTLAQIRAKVEATIASVTDAPEAKRHVRQWCYYSAHDVVCFDNLFGGMINVPESFAYHAIDLRLLTDVFGQKHDSFNPDAKYPHHPLFDALAQYETAKKLAVLVEKKMGPEGIGMAVRHGDADDE